MTIDTHASTESSYQQVWFLPFTCNIWITEKKCTQSARHIIEINFRKYYRKDRDKICFFLPRFHHTHLDTTIYSTWITEKAVTSHFTHIVHKTQRNSITKQQSAMYSQNNNSNNSNNNNNNRVHTTTQQNKTQDNLWILKLTHRKTEIMKILIL